MRALVGILVLLLTAGGCTRVQTASPPESRPAVPDPAALAPDPGIPSTIRFSIEPAPEDRVPVYVLVNGEDSQVGFVRVFREGERVFLQERCEIEDCGSPGVVCGAAIPMIADLASGFGSIEFLWDVTASTLDPVSGCEMRRPATRGEFTARFC